MHPDSFNHACDLAINTSSGVVHVTDFDNHRVQLFSADGQFINHHVHLFYANRQSLTWSAFFPDQYNYVYTPPTQSMSLIKTIVYRCTVAVDNSSSVLVLKGVVSCHRGV